MTKQIEDFDLALKEAKNAMPTYGLYKREPVIARLISIRDYERGIAQLLRRIKTDIPIGFKNRRKPNFCTTLEGEYPIVFGDLLILGRNGEVYPNPRGSFMETRQIKRPLGKGWYEFESTEIVRAVLMLEPFSVTAPNGQVLKSKDVPYWLIWGPITGFRPCHSAGFNSYQRL